MRIVLSARAQQRLRAIRAHIAKDDPGAAERVWWRIGQVIELLGDFPEMGPLWDERSRAVVVSGLPYRIHYRIEAETVRIVTVMHTAQRGMGR